MGKDQILVNEGPESLQTDPDVAYDENSSFKQYELKQFGSALSKREKDKPSGTPHAGKPSPYHQASSRQVSR